MDSDQGDRELKPAVLRLKEDLTSRSNAGAWITEGYTIENYVRPELLLEAAQTVHPSVEAFDGRAQKNRDPLKLLKRKGGALLARPDKVAIALQVSETPPDLGVHDLQQRVEELAEFLSETM